jgi:hypothetical protein
MSSILALDLGTTTGYARWDFDRVFTMSISWATPKEVTAWKRKRLTRRGDPRVLRFYDWLDLEIRRENASHIVFEDVEFCSQTYQCQLWTSFRTCVWLVAHLRGCQVEAVPVGTLKKFATGTGAATKQAMALALIKSSGGQFQWDRSKQAVFDTVTKKYLDDNAIDALWLYSWAQEYCTL